MKFDEVNYWSEIKLEIVREYAAAYSKILSAQKNPSLYHVYIDAFAGAGKHLSKTTGGFIPGSPLNALHVQPRFKEYHFIDLSRRKAESLRKMTGKEARVYIYQGDCNTELLNRVFPKVRYEDFRRGLCLLDPYGLHLNWRVIHTAAKMKSMEIFLNFPVADMNRNVLWRNPDRVDARQATRLDAFWGDNSWRKAAYATAQNLFGFEEKTENNTVAEAFQNRLKAVAGFAYVPDPLPMRNSKGAVVYYLFFGSQKPVAAHIVKEIFDKYRNRGAS